MTTDPTTTEPAAPDAYEQAQTKMRAEQAALVAKARSEPSAPAALDEMRAESRQ